MNYSLLYLKLFSVVCCNITSVYTPSDKTNDLHTSESNMQLSAKYRYKTNLERSDALNTSETQQQQSKTPL